jgi:hypothetical protein
MADNDETSTTANDPVAADIESRNPGTDDQVAGEQVLADDPSASEPRVAPEPDDFSHDDGPRHRADDAAVAETDRDRLDRHD